MAYSTSSPPVLAFQPVAHMRFWNYSSADPIATVNTASYISNGYHLGMRVGDTVLVRDTATPTSHLCWVVTASASTGAVDLTDGLAITATNTD